MPSISYTRHDYTVRIESDGEAAQILSTPPEGLTIRTPVALEILDSGVSGADADLRKVLSGVLSTPTIVALPSTVDRIVLEVGERRWAAIPFESFLPPNNWLVRSSPVRPRALQRPLAFPLRVLEIGLPLVVANAIEQTFRGAYRDPAALAPRCTPRSRGAQRSSAAGLASLWAARTARSATALTTQSKFSAPTE